MITPRPNSWRTKRIQRIWKRQAWAVRDTLSINAIWASSITPRSWTTPADSVTLEPASGRDLLQVVCSSEYKDVLLAFNCERFDTYQAMASTDQSLRIAIIKLFWGTVQHSTNVIGKHAIKHVIFNQLACMNVTSSVNALSRFGPLSEPCVSHIVSTVDSPLTVWKICVRSSAKSARQFRNYNVVRSTWHCQKQPISPAIHEKINMVLAHGYR